VKLRKPWQFRLVGRIGSLAIRALGATWRGRTRIVEPPEPGLYLVLHAHILFFVHGYRGRGYTTLISTHRDGEVIARIVSPLGFKIVRGSSTRGGVQAARELLRGCQGQILMVTPDGPRGPRGKVETGLLQIAARAGLPVRTLGFAASRARKLASWDRFVVPKAFCRVHAVLGEPVHIPRDADAATIEALAAEFSRRLLETELAAERGLAP